MSTEVEIPENMHIDTTQNDGITDTTPDPRKDAMELIFANRKAQIEAENNHAKEVMNTQDAPEPNDAPEPVDTTPPAKKVAESVAPNEPQTPVTDPNPGAAQTKKYQLAVNGRMIEMGEDDVVRAAQKVLSADERFEQAARMRQEAQMYGQQQQPQTQPQQQRQPNQQPQQQGFDPMQVIDDNTADDLVKKINFGSEIEQRNAIRELGAVIATGLGRANQGPTSDQVVEMATQRALAHISFQNNLQAIGKEYSDVFESRPLTIAAADTVGQLRTQYAAQGVQKDDFTLYREACESIRSQFLKKPEAPAENTPPANSVQAAQPAINGDKFERKRAAPQPPAAASMVATETPKPKGYDPSSIVQQMRKQRGQSAY